MPALAAASLAPRPAASRTARCASVALPAAPAIRPQLASRPWTAALTSDDEITARAIARASASSAAPVTWQVTSAVAPSPSAACWRARSRATASMAAPSAARAPASLAASAAPAFPDASTNTVSLVLVSPSTDSWSHVRAAAPRSSAWSVAGSAVASVRTTDSIVAMLGWIIPTPFAIPVTVTSTVPAPEAAAIATVVVAILVVVSVVRSAAAADSSAASVAARPPSTTRRMPAVTRSTGSRVPMIPVDRWRICASGASRAPASAVPIAAWSASPAAPVAAFALPEVETTARA